ncbi:MAG TPA: carbon monoxide dehydrogenase [Alphaproteobacteria bacterium]|nr:carbon monoxide dehydrogenase [Alphaproteobacteria bacterium]HCV61726.1 carbon monoxide dehydrogenase [Alphaproteobacteria bacterium]|tara:strand:+ start:270 stop:1061 length:792 start_codon:yes stop_codon:yes gene_type:complete
MYETRYTRPSSTGEAAEIISAADEGKLLAGGMTLIPTMKQRLAAPDCLVDLAGCGLGGITDEGSSIRIGAMTTHAEVELSGMVQSAIPAVASLAGGIGDRQVRNCGTIGGSLANNDPSACYPAAVLALGGIVHTSTRSLTAPEFFSGMFETALKEDEIIVAVSLPKPVRAAYVKFPNPASRYAMVGVFVAVMDGGITVAITGAGQDGVYRHDDLEAALTADFSPEAVDRVTFSADGLLSDIHASADYRASLIRAMAKRAVAAC